MIMTSIKQITTVSALIRDFSKILVEEQKNIEKNPALLGSIIYHYLNSAYEQGKRDGEKTVENMVRNN